MHATIAEPLYDQYINKMVASQKSQDIPGISNKLLKV
jgi:hypothetical protein